jgi:hypothetical protein
MCSACVAKLKDPVCPFCRVRFVSLHASHPKSTVGSRGVQRTVFDVIITVDLVNEHEEDGEVEGEMDQREQHDVLFGGLEPSLDSTHESDRGSDVHVTSTTSL